MSALGRTLVAGEAVKLAGELPSVAEEEKSASMSALINSTKYPKNATN
jgi:hypothetical protein